MKQRASSTTLHAPARSPALGQRARELSLLGLLCVALACRSGDVNPTPAPAPAPAAAASSSAAGAPPTPPRVSTKPWHIPVGPRLPILPGKGFGPIRFGARLDTIERLIGEPCEETLEQGAQVTCRYSAQAVEFVLVKGVVTEMRAHRLGRPFKPGAPEPDYGIFNGGFENGVAFGMLQPAVRELLGPPEATRAVQGDNPNHTVEVQDYGSFSLEFDRTSPQSVVLGGVILKSPPGGPPKAAAAPETPEQAKPARPQRPLH